MNKKFLALIIASIISCSSSILSSEIILQNNTEKTIQFAILKTTAELEADQKTTNFYKQKLNINQGEAVSITKSEDFEKFFLNIPLTKLTNRTSFTVNYNFLRDDILYIITLNKELRSNHIYLTLVFTDPKNPEDKKIITKLYR